MSGSSQKSSKAHNPRAPRVKVIVTKEQIEDSVERDSSHCMIAEAVKAAYPNAKKVSVDLQTIRFSDPEKRSRYTYLTPRRAQVALVQWDQGIKPEPFDLTLRQGQVTFSGSRQVRESKPISEAQRRALAKARKVSKAKLVPRDKKNGIVPEKVGGKTPPLARNSENVPFSNRRAFGLRGLEY